MDPKRIIILESDDTVLHLLQGSLLGYSPDLEIQSFSSPDMLCEQLDCIECDVFICAIDSLEDKPECIEPLVQWKTTHFPKVVATAYEPETSEVATRLGATYHLHKPLEQNAVHSILEELLDHPRRKDLGKFSISKAQYNTCLQRISSLRSTTNARCVLLSDSVGRVLVHTGNLEGLAADAITSLLGGGIATLMETAEMIDDESIINLTLFEGKKTDLYAINIGVKLLLILIIDKGRNYSRLGTVWFYAKQTAIDLEHLLMEETVANPEEEPRFDSNIESQISDEIDRLMS